MERDSTPPFGLFDLPRELRNHILSIVLFDLPVYVTQWTCSRSAVARLQGLSLRIASVEHATSASASLDFFARSDVLQASQQLRQEAADVLRTVGYHVLVVTHGRHLQTLLLASSAILQKINAVYLADACRCGEQSGSEDVHDPRHDALCVRILTQMPRLRHLFLSASTTLAAVDLEVLGLYMCFFRPLREGRLSTIFVECGTIRKGNYAADVDYERSWLLGPPRVRHRTQQEFYTYQMREVARRNALREWLVCLDMPGYVAAYWPLPVRREGGLRFILQGGKPPGVPSGVNEA